MSSYTPTLPMETFLLEAGFNKTSDCKLNAFDPMYRSYHKDGLGIVFGFGLKSVLHNLLTGETIKDSALFYFFVSTNPNAIYRVITDKKDLLKAINSKLTRIA